MYLLISQSCPTHSLVAFHQKDVDPMLISCWSSVVDRGANIKPALVECLVFAGQYYWWQYHGGSFYYLNGNILSVILFIRYFVINTNPICGIRGKFLDDLFLIGKDGSKTPIRLEQWTKVKPTLIQLLVSAGMIFCRTWVTCFLLFKKPVWHPMLQTLYHIWYR